MIRRFVLSTFTHARSMCTDINGTPSGGLYGISKHLKSPRDFNPFYSESRRRCNELINFICSKNLPPTSTIQAFDEILSIVFTFTQTAELCMSMTTNAERITALKTRQRMTLFYTELCRIPALSQAVKRLESEKHLLSEEDQMFVRKLKISFENEGSFLCPDKREQLDHLNHKIDCLSSKRIIKEYYMAQQGLLVLFLLALLCKAMSIRSHHQSTKDSSTSSIDGRFCLSWRLAVETNNELPWRTVPNQCSQYVEDYLIHGQYERDLELIMEQALNYVNGIPLVGDGMDAWILDVDDTCISNIYYYKSKNYGCVPYDPPAFRAWAVKGWCTAIPPVLRLFNKLIDNGFKVILLTGRDKETLYQATIDNLHNQGFIGYDQLIMRTAVYKGQSAVMYKSNIRKQLEDEGYRIWGNVGDQWSDLQGNSSGNRTFKLPNPMYFVP